MSEMEIDEMESWSDAALESCINGTRAAVQTQDRFVAALELWHRGKRRITELEALREKQSDQISKQGAEIEKLRKIMWAIIWDNKGFTQEDIEWAGQYEIKLRDETIAEQSEHTSKLGKENLELRQALRYLADEGNYDKHEEDEDYYRLVRPGGARKEGIFSLSRHLCAWVYAEAVGDEWQALQDHERIERLVLAENKDDRED